MLNARVIFMSEFKMMLYFQPIFKDKEYPTTGSLLESINLHLLPPRGSQHISAIYQRCFSVGSVL